MKRYLESEFERRKEKNDFGGSCAKMGYDH